MYSRKVSFGKENGRTCVYVPLGKSELTCTIWKDDFDLLLSLGASANWSVIGKRYVGCAGKGRGRNLVARLLLDCGPGKAVKYIDGNAFNLRRENLVAVDYVRAIARDRDFLRSASL